MGWLKVRITWENYYSSLKRLPGRLKKPVPFVVEDLPTLKRHKVKNVLDLGCGGGRPSVFLAKNSFNVIGVDVSRSALRIAKKWVQNERLTNAAFVCGTMTNLPFSNRHFDAVISVSVIHHAVKNDIAKTVAEAYRILNENGIFLANVASVEDPRFGIGEKVELGTFRILEAFEEKRFEELHHFFTKGELSKLLAIFGKARIELLKEKPNYWKITAIK